MNLRLLRSQCDNGRTCPNINASDRGTFVVQGYLPPVGDSEQFPLPAGESVVEIPLSLLSDTDTAKLHLTDRGTALVRGTTVVDAEALAELDLPDGESAVEVPTSMFPALSEDLVANAR